VTRPDAPGGGRYDVVVVGGGVVGLSSAWKIASQGMTVADADFSANRDWIKQHIRWEFYYRVFGKNVAERARWSEDPEVLQAIESMPKAQSLLSTSQKVYAMRR